MSVITATPVPTEPPKVPTRIVEVNRITGLARIIPWHHCYEPSRVDLYRLPGTDEAAALAELEKASEGLEGMFGAGFSVDQIARGRIGQEWIMARRNLRRVQAEQSGGKP